jgi:hypothetical protein
MRRQDLAIILLSGDTRWNASVSVCRADLRRYLLEAKQSYSSHPGVLDHIPVRRRAFALEASQIVLRESSFDLAVEHQKTECVQCGVTHELVHRQVGDEREKRLRIAVDIPASIFGSVSVTASPSARSIASAARAGTRSAPDIRRGAPARNLG